MKLIITIDTEEDNWADYRSVGASVRNIERIPRLQALFDEFGMRPTYLIDYPVATDRFSAGLFRRYYGEGRCEIGMHCHPWNTPPFEEMRDERTSMICNLPAELQFRKLQVLHEAISRSVGAEPVSFRAGRWAFSADVARNIRRLGYLVDTSITPYVDWSGSHGPDFSSCTPGRYRFSAEDIFKEAPNGEMVEVPATVGFLQGDFERANSLHRAVRGSRLLTRLKVNGIMSRLNIVNKVWLSPELSTSLDMIRLARRFRKNGYEFLNMSFHSPTLMRGNTPFTRDRGEEMRFFSRIKEFLRFAKDEGIESVTLSEAVHDLKGHGGPKA